ncbi:MAG: hypothetical protein AUJ24_02260 [Parcubacteria group bacterium CG1_02_36_42]|nr:MAG: hypothetical protein AUJ24_02260 [Parcubacteria group bacterium CG1_02_36_42]
MRKNKPRRKNIRIRNLISSSGNKIIGNTIIIIPVAIIHQAAIFVFTPIESSCFSTGFIGRLTFSILFYIKL